MLRPKNWTIYNTFVQRLEFLDDNDFGRAMQLRLVKLIGCRLPIQIEGKMHKIWIDAITVTTPISYVTVDPQKIENGENLKNKHNKNNGE